jgi:hypothetical protein
VAVPVLTGAAAFGAFFGAAVVARHIPVLNEALVSVLSYAERGSDSWVLTTTLANGVAEEVFFRGSLFTALGSLHPVAASTGAYVLSTCATRNPALVLAAGVMGSVFAAQRRATGGLLAPILTHVTWWHSCCATSPHSFANPRPGPANAASAWTCEGVLGPDHFQAGVGSRAEGSGARELPHRGGVSPLHLLPERSTTKPNLEALDGPSVDCRATQRTGRNTFTSTNTSP